MTGLLVRQLQPIFDFQNGRCRQIRFFPPFGCMQNADSKIVTKCNRVTSDRWEVKATGFQGGGRRHLGFSKMSFLTLVKSKPRL
jgi:hypothetical protein